MPSSSAFPQMPPNVGRSLETGTILGILVGVLALTGLAISPTVESFTGAIDAQLGYWVYATHLASASLLVVFLVWHLLPFGHSFSRKAGAVSGWMLVASHTLLAFVLVEIVTGIVLYFHLYDLVDKRVAALTHLVTTFIVLAPLAIHVWRGVRVWLERRASRASAMAAATARGREAQAEAAYEAVSRRSFLRLSAMAVAGVGLAFAFGRYAFGDVMGWRVNKVGKVPALTKDGYRLRITGMVANPIELTYQQLRALPEREVDITHHCVEGWSYRDTFTGVPLPHLIELAGGLLPGAKQPILKSPEVSEQYFGAGPTLLDQHPGARREERRHLRRLRGAREGPARCARLPGARDEFAQMGLQDDEVPRGDRGHGRRRLPRLLGAFGLSRRGRSPGPHLGLVRLEVRILDDAEDVPPRIANARKPDTVAHVWMAASLFAPCAINFACVASMSLTPQYAMGRVPRWTPLVSGSSPSSKPPTLNPT